MPARRACGPVACLLTDHLMPLVLVALHTGLLAGDLFSLEWSHINLERGQITKVINKTRRKTIKPVTLPLRNDAVAVLKVCIAISERAYSGFTQVTDAQNDASNLVSTQATGPRV